MELLVEGVVPDLLHGVPVSDDLYGVLDDLDGGLELEDLSPSKSLVSNPNLPRFPAFPQFRAPVLVTAHDGREDTSGGVISSKSSLNPFGTTVHNKGLSFFLTHLGFSVECSRLSND